MSSYDPYDAPQRSSKRYYREERRDDRDRDPRYVDTRDSYLTVSRDLVPRPREDSDISVEEIRRDFPPPGYSNRDIRRSRSAEAPHYDEYDQPRSHHTRDRAYDQDYDRDYDRRGKSSVYYEEERKKKARVLGKQEQIIAALAGAALAIGGKELYDRREAKEHKSDVERNVLTSAALGAAGALAGYQGTEFYNKHKEKEEKKSVYTVQRGRDGKVIEYYSDSDETPKEKKGHKNFLEGALAAAGLGGAVKALTGGSSKDDRSETRSRHGGRSRSGSSSSRSRSKENPASKIQKAAMASLIAGATEAFRISKEPGGWKGEKAKRIFTAAAGAAGIDAAQSSDKAGSKVGLAESVLGGLLGNRVLNGSKKNIEEDTKTGRSRSRSRARSSGGGGGATGIAALATAGLGTVAANKILGKRDDRSRSRRRSADSDESPDRRHRSRSRSVVDTARRGLAKLGIGNGPDDDVDDDRRNRSRRDYDDYDSPRGSRRHGDDYDRRSRGRDDYDDDRDDRGSDRGQRSERALMRHESDSDLGDSDEDEKRSRKMKGKQIITTGLAAVATIHAAANVYQSMEKRNARRKAVREGRLSPDEAKKLKSKALLQDAASVGIAALGIKGAVSEFKEARETSHAIKEWKEKKEERHQRRLERQQFLLGDGGDDSDDGGYGRQRADRRYSTAPPRADRYNEGPRYTDGNPYAAQSDRG
ncbi:hypothetical protein B0H67DRAFT_476263 [Lasiosphaeris hirsuta]|uniref:Uncharacterized protein n=1 Tax=Lasiosphaeris hirsuta TaxID=260670 RepID=A0AA40BAE4_9PEZI|nr:hypothetical protein B0H67DRAFT_476263 [Lasiosphaeris hirsuta]